MPRQYLSFRVYALHCCFRSDTGRCRLSAKSRLLCKKFRCPRIEEYRADAEKWQEEHPLNVRRSKAIKEAWARRKGAKK